MTIAELIAEPLRTGLSRAGSATSTHVGLTLSSVRNGRLDLTATKPIDLTPGEEHKYQVRTGAFYVVRGNGRLSLVGRGALAPDDISTQVAFPDLLIEVVPDPSLIDSRYLALVWNEGAVRSDIEGRARTSSGIHKINLANLRSVRLPVPSLANQRRIVAVLSEQLTANDAAKVGTSSRLEVAASLRIRAYKVAFADCVPLSVGPRLDWPPTGWAWQTLTDIARLETGHTPSRSRPDWWTGDIPWIALPDIRRLDGQIAVATAETTNADGIANSSARILPTDTVVMSRTASVGFVTRMGRPMATSQDFVNWVCGPDLDPEFLMHLLIRSRDEIRALSSGAIHKTVYFPTVRAFRVCVPAIDEQRRIVAELTERLAAIAAMDVSIRAEQEAIEALPAALLRRAFQDLAA